MVLNPSPRLLVAAAGTGGHILPGIRVGREFARRVPGGVVAYVCGAKPIEARIYAGEGIEPVVLGGNYSAGGPIRRIGAALADLRSAIRLLRRQRPTMVLAMGGGACVPILVAAALLRIPYFLHESNAIPGRVVRLFGGGARAQFRGLGRSTGGDIIVTGTPTPERLGTEATRNTVLCVGGSQGAARLNELFLEAARQLAAAHSSIRFLLVSGPGRAVADPGPVEVVEYIHDMPAILARTIVAVSRSGSGSLADLSTYGVPAILVPYPHAMDDHQTANACLYAADGAAVVEVEASLTATRLASILEALLTDDERRRRMAEAAQARATPDAAERIVNEMMARLGGATAVAMPRIKDGAPHAS